MFTTIPFAFILVCLITLGLVWPNHYIKARVAPLTDQWWRLEFTCINHECIWPGAH